MGFDVSHLPQVQSLHSSFKKVVFSRHKRCKRYFFYNLVASAGDLRFFYSGFVWGISVSPIGGLRETALISHRSPCHLEWKKKMNE